MGTASTQRPNPRAVAFGAKLQRVLDERRLSRRAFAKLVSPKNPEGVRRAVHRHLQGIHMPSRLTLRRYEVVLGLESGTLELDDADDKEDDLPSLDELLRLRIRQIVREETVA